MNRMPHIFVGSLLIATTLAACGSATDRGVTGNGVTPSPSAAGTVTAPTPEVRIWGGFAVSIPYGSFAEWSQDVVRQGNGVALVRITDVSPVRWSTATGEGPGPGDIARYNRAEVEFTIGRLVAVELVRMLRGTWPASGTTALYWLPGGQLGNDLTLAFSGDATLNEPRPGALAVASTWPGVDLDDSDGVVWLNVNRLFPADVSGRLRTYNPDETISVNDVERYLPAP